MAFIPLKFIDADTQSVIYSGPWAIRPNKGDTVTFVRADGTVETYKVNDVPTYQFTEIEEPADNEGGTRLSWMPPVIIVELKEQT